MQAHAISSTTRNPSPATGLERACSNYFYLRGDLDFDFKLPADFHLRLRAAGQAAAEPLITNEDFSIAGIDGVGGYLESEVLGDEGIRNSSR